MILFSALWWFGQFISIFIGLTFTDWQDFTPLASLVLGIAGALYLNTRKDRAPSFALYVLVGLLAIWPILPNIGLYFLACEYQSIFKTWPQPMANDPKGVYGNGHVTYDAIYHIVHYLEAFAGAWMVAFFSLFFGNMTRFSVSGRRIIWASFGISMLLYFLDIGNLNTWWLD